MKLAKECGIPDVLDRPFVDVQIMLEAIADQTKKNNGRQNLAGTLMGMVEQFKHNRPDIPLHT